MSDHDVLESRHSESRRGIIRKISQKVAFGRFSCLRNNWEVCVLGIGKNKIIGLRENDMVLFEHKIQYL